MGLEPCIGFSLYWIYRDVPPILIGDNRFILPVGSLCQSDRNRQIVSPGPADEYFKMLEKNQSRNLNEIEGAFLQTPFLEKVVNSSIEQWDRLIRYVDDGILTSDNNIAENDICPFVVGRKNSRSGK